MQSSTACCSCNSFPQLFLLIRVFNCASRGNNQITKLCRVQQPAVAVTFCHDFSSWFFSSTASIKVIIELFTVSSSSATACCWPCWGCLCCCCCGFVLLKCDSSGSSLLRRVFADGHVWWPFMYLKHVWGWCIWVTCCEGYYCCLCVVVFSSWNENKKVGIRDHSQTLVIEPPFCHGKYRSNP